jgi:hypothetical protein
VPDPKRFLLIEVEVDDVTAPQDIALCAVYVVSPGTGTSWPSPSSAMSDVKTLRVDASSDDLATRENASRTTMSVCEMPCP